MTSSSGRLLVSNDWLAVCGEPSVWSGLLGADLPADEAHVRVGVGEHDLGVEVRRELDGALGDRAGLSASAAIVYVVVPPSPSSGGMTTTRMMIASVIPVEIRNDFSPIRSEISRRATRRTLRFT